MLRLSSLSLLLISATCFGQISITKDHMPKSGDKIEYSTAISPTIDVKTTGADVNWDYSTLTSSGNGVDEYKQSWQTPYILNFGFTAIGQKVLDTLGFSDFQMKNVYNFYKNSSSSFSDVGIGFQFATLPLPQAGKHSDPDEIYFFPLNYNDRDSSTFDVEIPIKAIAFEVGSFRRKGHRITEVDGWGKITTPYVKDEPCIRIKSVINETDSIKVSTPSFSFGSEISRIEYKWLSKNERIPILTIVGSEVAGRFVPTSIQYRNDWSKITPDFEATNVSPKVGDIITINNKTQGSGSYTWALTPSTGFMFVNGTTANSEHPVMVFQDTGLYTVKLTVKNDANTESEEKVDYLHVRDRNSSVEDNLLDGLLQYTVYPNPVQDKFNITFHDGQENKSASITIFSLDGKQIQSSFVQNTQIVHTMNVEALAKGNYIVNIVHGDAVYNHLLIKK
jgi:hypothetical protein